MGTSISSLWWIGGLFLFINIILAMLDGRDSSIMILLFFGIIIWKNILFCLLELNLWHLKFKPTSRLERDNKIRCAENGFLKYNLITLIHDLVSIWIIWWIISALVVLIN